MNIKATEQKLEELQSQINALEPSRPIWNLDKYPINHPETEELKTYRKVHRTAFYQFNKKRSKLSDEHIKLFVELSHYKTNQKYNELKKHCTNVKIQAFADILHDDICNHNEHCDYYYGNWATDPRMVMFEWYQKAEALLNRGINPDEYKDALAKVNEVTKMVQGEL